MNVHNFVIITISFVLLSFARAQNASSPTSGCVVKNGEKVISEKGTYQDDSWWYQCKDNKLIARGCVVNGKRYDIGETFLGYLDNFYGFCESFEGNYVKSTIWGCLDIDGARIPPDNPYIVDKYFWANCTSTPKDVIVPGWGNVSINVISREIIGCNDGTYNPVPNDVNFAQITALKPHLAGIGLICRLTELSPHVEPVVCLVTNSSEGETFLPMTSGCYAQFQDYTYYCKIDARDSSNGTKEYSWELGWNNTTPENLADLKAKSLHDCPNQAPAVSQNATASSSPSQTRRLKRNVYMAKRDYAKGESSIVKRQRIRRLSKPLLQAESKVINIQIHEY